MKIKRLIPLVWLLFFTACNEPDSISSTGSELEKKSSNEVKSTKVESPKEKDLLKELGFEFNNDKIVIDINKTSNFFCQIEKEITAKTKEIESKIENIDINITNGLGIELEGNQIGIDLNKTQNMLQQINVLMKEIFLDINSSKN